MLELSSLKLCIHHTRNCFEISSIKELINRIGQLAELFKYDLYKALKTIVSITVKNICMINRIYCNIKVTTLTQ